jgi:putative transposase
VAFIATHADRETVDGLRRGVEPICRVLSEHGVPIVPSTYYDAVKAARRISVADLRAERLMLAIARVHHDNYGVYGARKVWLVGLEGARQVRTVRTTRSDPAAARPVDLVERDFNPARPDRLWVAGSPTARPGRGSSTSRSSSTPTRHRCDDLWEVADPLSDRPV